MRDHAVKTKLRNEVLPYLVSAQRLQRRWFYRLHEVFGYTTDLWSPYRRSGSLVRFSDC